MPIPTIQKHIEEFHRPKRKAISRKFPLLVKPAVITKRILRSTKNSLILPTLKKGDYLPCVVARHSSLLYRKLGDSDADLQKNKVTNLKIAISKLDGLIIPAGDVFSLWHAVGNVSRTKGYVEGMILSNGKVSKGIGGGLCQLSNFLFWILLHADVEIVERHHHSVDAFPDSGRTLPFGSGATIFDNYLDLKLKNVSKNPLQIKLWLTDNSLKGQILSDAPSEKKFHLTEKNHYFIRHGESYFRYNEIHRETLVRGQSVHDEKILINFAPVIYPVSREYLDEREYRLLDL